MIAGILLALFGIMAFAGESASWILFGLAMWGACYLLFGSHGRGARRRVRYAQWMAMQQPPAPVPPPPPAPVLPTPSTTRLPDDVARQVDRIKRKAAVLGQHQERFPIGSKDLYVVQHTATDYLPATLNAFLEVPAWSVTTPTADGRTPLKMLHDQLDLLETKLDEIAESLKQQRVDRLLANGRFLEEHFGQSDEHELTIRRGS